MYKKYGDAAIMELWIVHVSTSDFQLVIWGLNLYVALTICLLHRFVLNASMTLTEYLSRNKDIKLHFFKSLQQCSLDCILWED